MIVDGATPRSAAACPGATPDANARANCFRSRRKQCMPGRLSSGLLAQQSSELAPVRLAAIERNANCFLLQDAVQVEP